MTDTAPPADPPVIDVTVESLTVRVAELEKELAFAQAVRRRLAMQIAQHVLTAAEQDAQVEAMSAEVVTATARAEQAERQATAAAAAKTEQAAR